MRKLAVALVVSISAALAPPAEADAMTIALQRMSLEERVGQLFVTWVHGQRADEPNPNNRKDFGVDTAAQVVEKFHPGGVIYFNNSSRDNIDTPGQIAALSNGLQRASRIPLAISTDQEMGLVTRIGPPATQFPGNMALGAGRSAKDAEQAARITAAELRAMGINQDFAPDADVNSNPANPIIGVRSYSSDPTLASELVKAQIKGYEQHMFAPGAVSATAKHFPGHGDTKDDSHTSLPVATRNLEQWREIDAPPFKAAVQAKVDSIMTAHIQMPNIDPSGEPATLSKRIITGLLREELHYDGVIVTDALGMAGVRVLHPNDAEIPILALKAGADQLLMPVDLERAINAVVAAVKSGELTEWRINQSVLRILRMKFLRGILNTKPVDENVVIGTQPSLDAAQRITDRTITAIRNDGNVLPFHPLKPLVVGTSENPAKALAGHLNATTSVTSLNPTAEQIDAAVAAAATADAVVLLTNGLYVRPAQQELLFRLQATGKPVVAVATGVPYDVAQNAPVWLATYGTTGPSMAALAKVLTGQAKPQGKLPVHVSGKYPFGHGLSW
ncbi:beta-N-acetylhexosaminidase [Lentzea sp. NBRC 105346]|nr:beta-N-acetylhexosaminidase [Lentzea sp. NBRC 105346]